jgi:hypothetical protein
MQRAVIIPVKKNHFAPTASKSWKSVDGGFEPVQVKFRQDICVISENFESMTKLICLALSIFVLSNIASAQLKVTDACPTFSVDILEGNINRIHPRSTSSEITRTFPCQTGVEESIDSTGRCQGVFYKNKGVNFFTGRNYIEIDNSFKGKMEPAIMGAAKGSLFSVLGNPKLKDIEWEAYQTKYGTLIVYYSKANRINKIQMTTKSTDNIKLCE